MSGPALGSDCQRSVVRTVALVAGKGRRELARAIGRALSADVAVLDLEARSLWERLAIPRVLRGADVVLVVGHGAAARTGLAAALGLERPVVAYVFADTPEAWLRRVAERADSLVVADVRVADLVRARGVDRPLYVIEEVDAESAAEDRPVRSAWRIVFEQALAGRDARE